MRAVRSLPPPAFYLLRGARETCLRLLSPADFFCRLFSGRRLLPPLWLRRRAGSCGLFESAASEMAEVLAPLCLVAADDLVIDVGCGAGAMVPPLLRVLGPRGRYIGVDVDAAALRWCREAFASDARLRFERVGGGGRLPAGDREAGFVLAKSVFTHLLERDARHLLSEIRRVLAPGRTAAVTALLFEPGEGERQSARDFPFASEDGSSRWRWKARPESGLAFERGRFLEMVADAGLRVDSFVPGFWPCAQRPRGQDLLLLSYGAPLVFVPCPRSRWAPKAP